MERTIYIYDRNKISEHTITIHNYQFSDVYLRSIIFRILDHNSKTISIYDAIADENLEAIEDFLGNDKKLWKEFYKYFLSALDNNYNEIPDESILSSFEKAILNNPNFIITEIRPNKPLYPFFLKYLSYAHISYKDFYYMLRKDRKLLVDKLNDMVRSRFPDHEYDENIIDTILSYGYKLSEIPEIIKKFITPDTPFDSLEEFLSNKDIMVEHSYSSDEEEREKEEKYYIRGDSIYFNMYYYKDRRIVLDQVIIKTDKNTIKLLDKLGVLVVLENNNLMEIFHKIIRDKKSIKPIVEYLSNKKKEWSILSSVLSRARLSDKYIKKNRNDFLTIFNHPYFRITSDMISKPLNRASDLLDEIKLKSDRDVIPNYINTHTNKNVTAYLIYDLLNDVFKNSKYWKSCYKYMNVVDSYTDIIIDRVDNTDIIREIFYDEGITVERHNNRHMYNILTLLCIEYYTLKKDLSGINSLRQYTERIVDSTIDLDLKLSYDELFEQVLDL